MAEDNSKKYSDEELDRIIAEYTNISKSRQNTYADIDNVDSDIVPEQPKKKFVLHIDESIIDSQPQTEAPKESHGNTGGIYFSNYQRRNSVQRQNARPVETQQSAPTQQRRQPQSSSAVVNGLENVKNQITKTVKKKTKAIGGKAALSFFIFIMISTIVLSSIGLACVGDMLAINRSEENVEVEIKPDADYKEIIDVLKKNKLIKQKLFCYTFAKYRGFDEKDFLSGNYYLNSKMGVEGMLRELMEAPATSETVTLSFPEGFTTSEIFEKLSKYDVGDANKLYSAARSETYNKYSFINDIKADDSRYLKLDGYLFPDTYDFYVGADANYIIKKFLDNFEAKWEDEYDARAKKMGYTRDEIIIIASIIQKEAANNDQMRIVSSIIHNRLNNSANFPTLGCDSTKDYIEFYVKPVIGEGKGAFYASKYSTAANAGLPPGPICNPGLEAIRAALYPDDTDYYFFCHDDSRKIYVAKTQKEHEANVAKAKIANAKAAQSN
ncbi:MAG: endolytic transglycosylase MltG [Clostridia bacterium]|nr:endolytic transglycosylase MltG [Clostridia bacterium]